MCCKMDTLKEKKIIYIHGVLSNSIDKFSMVIADIKSIKIAMEHEVHKPLIYSHQIQRLSCYWTWADDNNLGMNKNIAMKMQQ